MARNRKNQPADIRLGPALKACLMCLLILFCCVGYVWQKKQIHELAEQIRRRETRLRELRAQNERLRQQMATSQTAAALEARVKELNLGLMSPQLSQIWRLTEPAVETPATGREQSYPGGASRALATALIR